MDKSLINVVYKEIEPLENIARKKRREAKKAREEADKAWFFKQFSKNKIAKRLESEAIEAETKVNEVWFKHFKMCSGLRLSPKNIVECIVAVVEKLI